MTLDIRDCEPFQTRLLPPVYGTAFAIALVGNIFTLYLLWTKEKRDWHSVIVLSCNLAISDLLYISTWPLLIVYYALQKHWVFGNAACKIERFLFNWTMYAGIFFIMAISVKRGVSIKFPIFGHKHIRPKRAKITSVIIWIVAGIISSPVLYFASTCPDLHLNKTLCVSYCEQHNTERSHYHYNLFLSVFGCAFPFLITLASYCVMNYVIWTNKRRTAQQKLKLPAVGISFVLLYAISFLPYHGFLMNHLHLKITEQVNCSLFNTYQVTKGLVTLNMCIHPLLCVTVVDSIVAACQESRKNTTQEMN